MSMMLSERSLGRVHAKIKHTKIETGNLLQNGHKFLRNSKVDSNEVVQATTSRVKELNDSRAEHRMPPTPCGKTKDLQQQLIKKNLKVVGIEAKSTKMTGGDAFLASAKSKTLFCLMPNASSHSISKNGRGVFVARHKVLDVLKQFEELFAQLLEEWESMPMEERKGRCRADIKAANILRKKGKWINYDPYIGNVPGVQIGDRFQYRVELAIIGLHREYMFGIHSEKIDGKSFATSIVDSGRYRNETVSADEFIYIGEGGNPEVSSGLKDHTLDGGNLSLKNSMDSEIPVRVIRCSNTLGASNTMGINRRSGRAYLYAGLFQVTECTHCNDPKFGYKCFKFRMKRMTDDPNVIHQTSSVPRISTIRRKQDMIDDMSCQEEEKLNSAVKNVKTSKFIYSSTPKGCGGYSRNKDETFDYGAVAFMAKPLISNRRSCANGANAKLKLS